jgi:hypothetical protein
LLAASRGGDFLVFGDPSIGRSSFPRIARKEG